MRGVLDDHLLNGAHEIEIALHPQRTLRAVASVDEAVETIAALCQSWGGAGQPLASTYRGHAFDYVIDDAVRAEVDGYVGDLRPSPAASPYLEDVPFPADYPAALILAHRGRDQYLPVESVDLDDDDPWRLAYLGTLGTLPADLDEGLCRVSGIERLTHDEIFPHQHVRVRGGLGDLLCRLKSDSARSPREMSSYYLALGQQPDTSYSGESGTLPDRWAKFRAAGPNIIVVMSPNDVDDLALLWNLRAVWGDSYSMPIGIPREALDAEALHRLHKPGTATFFGWSGGHLFLTSESLDESELTHLAALGHGVEVASPPELLRLSGAPARRHRTVGTWVDGVAHVVDETEEDRAVLAMTSHTRPTLRAAVRVPGVPVPTVGPLRGRYWPGFHFGAAQLPSSYSKSRRGALEVRWPSAWTSLVAAAQEHDLDVRQSQPGTAALALVHALDELQEAYLLSDPNVLDFLYHLAELSGMSWWKKRWARLEATLRAEGKSDAEVEALAVRLGRDEPVIAPPAEGRWLSFSDIKARLGRRDAAEKWVAWALERRLLVKGVGVSCASCRASFWVPEANLAPPHVCPGCGRSIVHAFRHDTATFSYRVGEVLRRCLEADALGHVLSMRWLVDLFTPHGLVGAHPGVEFLRDGKVIAEVDVIMLFADGTLVPVEVKRRASAFDASAAAQLDVASAALNAPWDIGAVLDAPEDDAAIWEQRSALPGRPRFIMTLDHLMSPDAIWGAGADPFATAAGERPEAGHERWLRAVAGYGESNPDPVAGLLSRWRTKRATAVSPDNGVG